MSTSLPHPVAETQVGIWVTSNSEVIIRDFRIHTHRPKAFVVMQFSTPYNELYQEVIAPVCLEYDIEAERGDNIYSQGTIISEIARKIDEARLVIAEITPSNPNVYYEVGYSHARAKPTILIADRKLDRLPFDVSPFRTLYYENSIDGKRRIEESLRRHIEAIVGRAPHS
ncbi:MAG: hypothetical protein NT069_17040 [Planctomycetota bacterium]|nr:hypothetical protein [Planctomycetota bacterium]